jgi:two-component system phosphate regulon response regulator OmpR
MTDAATRTSRQPQPLPDNAPHVLIVDDDQRIRDLLASYLQNNGYRTTTAGHVEAARSSMRGLAFDIVILDVMMPGELNGIDFARELKGHSRIPILMLTARSEAESRIKGLEAGVDDYLGKPFEPRELLLRLNNILKRQQQSDAPPAIDEIHMGAYAFHVGRGELKRGDESIKLTERERDLMRLFASRRGATIPRHELITGEATGSERAVDVQINRLRRKIEVDPSNPVYLQTVRGKGYILHTD